jgi:hypothetical protein
VIGADHRLATAVVFLCAQLCARKGGIMATALRKRSLTLRPFKTVLGPLRVEIVAGNEFCRYVDLPDPRADYCDSFNTLAEESGQTYRAKPVCRQNTGAIDRLLLTSQHTAHALSISGTTLGRLKKRGDIPFVMVGEIKAVRYSVEALRRWIKANQSGGGAE